MIHPTPESQPLAAFREDPTPLLQQLQASHRPITLTVDGQPSIVLQEASAYQRLLDIVAAAALSEGIRQGLEELRNGAGRPVSEFLAEMRTKYGLPG